MKTKCSETEEQNIVFYSAIIGIYREVDSEYTFEYENV